MHKMHRTPTIMWYWHIAHLAVEPLVVKEASRESDVCLDVVDE